MGNTLRAQILTKAAPIICNPRSKDRGYYEARKFIKIIFAGFYLYADLFLMFVKGTF